MTDLIKRLTRHVSVLEGGKEDHPPSNSYIARLIEDIKQAASQIAKLEAALLEGRRQMRDECAEKANEQEVEQAALARRYVRSGTLFAEHENARRIAERIAASIRSIEP